jgi:hypothetical protein
MRRTATRLAMMAALITSGTGWISPADAGIVLQTPAGLVPGDQFRFVFVTDGVTTAESTSITTYDTFVQGQAGGATYDGVTVTWQAIGTTPSVAAIDHIGQPQTPITLVDDTEVTTSTTSTGLWSGLLHHSINEGISGATIQVAVWTGTGVDEHHPPDPIRWENLTPPPGYHPPKLQTG